MSRLTAESGCGFRERKRSIMDSTSGWPKEKALFAGEKTIMPISTPHSVASSLAFLNNPIRCFEKVT